MSAELFGSEGYPAFGPPEVPPPFEVPDLPFEVVDVGVDVPAHLDVLPDGREVVVEGDVERWAADNHRQGENSLGFEGTCGLVSCEDILRQYGLECSEDDIVRFAVDHRLCSVTDDPLSSGGTSPETQAEILSDLGVPAHVEHHGSFEDLASAVEEGRSAIIEVNAGVLWDDANYFDNGQYNHAVVVTGVARDPFTGQIEGFFINDSGNGNSGVFVDAATMHAGWTLTGGEYVVTDALHGLTADTTANNPIQVG